MKTLATIALLAGVAVSQEAIETYHPDGRIRERYSVDAEGKKQGSYEAFRPDGSLSLRASYQADALDELYVRYDSDGREELQAMYRRGKRSGYWRESENGIRRLAANYRRDVLEGRWESFHEDGSRHVLAGYRKGQLHGRYVESRPADHWERTAAYQKGVLWGKAKITVRRKTISVREWQAGALVRLDGIAPFPVDRADLENELTGALVVPAPIAGDALSSQRMAALARLRAYRALCGLPWRELELVPKWNDLCDAASEVCRANGGLSHKPKKPDGMDDARFQQGYLGASRSNLSSGGLLGSVDSYMDDSDPSNIDRVGHRRWCLNPGMGKVGFGAAGHYSAMWAMDSSGSTPAGVDAVFYPPRGWVPVDFFGPRHAWSIHLLRGGAPSRDEDIDVKIHRLDEHYLPVGEPLPLDWKARAGGGFGGGPCVVFRPVGLTVRPGARYRVAVSFDGGKILAHDYLVEFVATVTPQVK